MKRTKIYAYVTSECCTTTKAEKPGAEVGGKPVSEHNDYEPWTAGKRATRALLTARHVIGYRHRAAQAVSELLGWSMPSTGRTHRTGYYVWAGGERRWFRTFGGASEEFYRQVQRLGRNLVQLQDVVSGNARAGGVA